MRRRKSLDCGRARIGSPNVVTFVSQRYPVRVPSPHIIIDNEDALHDFSWPQTAARWERRQSSRDWCLPFFYSDSTWRLVREDVKVLVLAMAQDPVRSGRSDLARTADMLDTPIHHSGSKIVSPSN